MRNKLIATSLYILLLVSCTNNKPHKTITDNIKQNKVILPKSSIITYKYRTFNYSDPGCKTKYDCGTISLKYPVFTQLVRLNNSVKNQVLNFLESGNTLSKEVDEIFNSFAKNFFQDCKDNSADETCSSALAFTIDVIKQDSCLIVTRMANEISGGAHPNVNYSFINWNIEKDKPVLLEDLLLSNYKTELTKVGEKIFRKDKTLPDTGSLGNYTFENDIFSLSGNFKITPKGLSFFYDNYQIAPYGEGPTDLLIPYSSIKHLLRRNTVISQYIK